jgi:guanosine-3',5'-bis(diphosphate) 3'-pyrophosphohydrolase
MDSSKHREVVLKVGADGGSVTLFRDRNAHGDWRFRMGTDESTLYDMLSEEDRGEWGDYRSQTAYVHSFNEAITLLDKYQWVELEPLHVLPEFLDAVLLEVRKRGGKTAEMRWREVLGVNTENGSYTENALTTPQSGISPADLLRAIAFAADKHSRQRRKDADASPYINHPIAVAAVLAIEGDVTDGTTLVAAILHDTVEDTETTFEELCGQFGEDISNLVREVTDDKSLRKALRKRLQIEHAAKSSDKAKQIKLADKICNIRDIMSSPPADWTLQRRIEYLDWSSKVVSGCRGVNEKLEQVFDNAMEQARESLR